jgi:hypothetical protein
MSEQTASTGEGVAGRGVRPPGARTALLGLLPSLVVDVALPLVTYFVLAAQGVPDLWALVLSGVWPLVSIVVSLVRKGRVDEFGVFILAVLLASTLSSVLFDDPRLLLLKNSVFTGVLGLVFLGSLLLKRPLMFYFGRKFGTDGSPEGLARWNSFWDELSVFRHGQRVMTLVWGLAFLAEALVRIPLVYALSVAAGVVIADVLPFVVVAALVTWTVLYAKRSAAASKAQAAALR